MLSGTSVGDVIRLLPECQRNFRSLPPELSEAPVNRQVSYPKDTVDISLKAERLVREANY